MTRTARIALAIAVAGGVVASVPHLAVAECTTVDNWRPFSGAMDRARSILVGTVVESLEDDHFGAATRFVLRVDEVIRGRAPAELAFGYVRPKDHVACDDSKLHVWLGDRLVFAFSDADPDVAHAPLAVGLIETRKTLRWEGLEYLSIGRIRSLAGLPPTDADMPLESSDGDVPTYPLLLIAGLSAAFIVRVATRKPGRSSDACEPSER